ncbi:MAG: M28 family peptidase [bacterium]
MRFLLTMLLVLSGSLVHSQQSTFSFSDSAILHRLKTDIYMLASDSFQGRQVGTKGDSLACEYLVSRYREIGLEPRGEPGGSYLQRFSYKTIYHPPSGNYLYTDYDHYLYRTDFGMVAFSANGKATGKLLNIGYGIFDSVSRVDDYTGKPEPAGRVLLMELPLPDAISGDSLRRMELSVRNRLSEAFRRGAVAVLLWNSDTPGYKDLFDFKRTDTLSGKVIFVTEAVANRLKKLAGQSVHLNATVIRMKIESNNLVGFVDNQATKTVILGAHFDHVGLNSRGVAKTGADDNASGTALILELARYLKNRGEPTCNYLFIAFGAEEEGMVGSNYFCKHPVIPRDQVIFMCNFDMVGRLGAEGNRLTALGTATSPQWKEVYRKMPKFGFRLKKYKGASNFSDQVCFYKEKIPIFYLTTGMHSDYHTHRDRPERINYTGMVQITRFTEEFITLAGQAGEIDFSKVSPWATLFSDLNYFIKQIGHMFEIPLQDW